MKKSLMILGILAAGISGFAQVTNSFESGSRSIDRNNCWYYSSTNVNSSQAIEGKYSCQTGALSGGIHFLQSPYILFSGPGTLTFSHKMDLNNGTTRLLNVYITNTSDQVVATVYTYNYPGNKTTVINSSVDINLNGVYRVKWEFTGTGGSSRGVLDQISIPGAYHADPTNNDGSGNCGSLPLVADADKDGVDDNNDAYPSDPYRAYNNLYPVKEWGSLGFEDMWPSRGDYDFNDLVVDYQCVAVTDASNEIVELKANFLTRAIGASYHNAFGVRLLGIPTESIIKVTNSLENALTGGTFKILETGVEAEQKFATVIVYDDAFKVLPHPGSGTGVNTTPGAPYVEPKTVEIVITLKEDGKPLGTAVNIKDWPESNVDFFMVVKANEGRGIEVHMADYQPTDLADQKLFGTLDDASNLGSNYTYRSVNNLPWAINILSSFAYPVEKADIVKAHLMYGPWAESSGQKFADWYLDLDGYRNYELIYKR